jgi:hypothetical protein
MPTDSTPAERGTRTLKVWGGGISVAGKNRRAIVAASSQREAAELVGIPLNRLRDYWPVTGNAREVREAMANPRTVLYYAGNEFDPTTPIVEVPHHG